MRNEDGLTEIMTSSVKDLKPEVEKVITDVLSLLRADPNLSNQRRKYKIRAIVESQAKSNLKNAAAQGGDD